MDVANEKKGIKDLTHGNPMELILKFGVPLLFGLVFQQLYNLVDSIIVGKLLGVNALAAVGSTASINFMVLGFCMGVCNGFAIPVAQSFGAKDMGMVKKYITNSAWMSIAFSVVLTTVIGLFTHKILEWMNTPASIMKDAYIYIFIIFMGIPLIFLYNMVSAILRSLGNSVAPLMFLIMSSVLNIILDIIMIQSMGIAGASVATVTAQGVSGIASLVYMICKYRHLNFEKEDWKLNGGCVGKLCGIGVPMGLQYSITGIGSVILQTAVNGLGEAVVAAVAAGTKISVFLICPYEAMGTTMATYGGQNVGAKRLDRIHQGLKDCLLLGVIYAILSLIVVLIFGKQLALLFVDRKETMIIDYINRFLIGNASCYLLLTCVNIFRFLIQGLGYSSFAIIAGICEMVGRGFVGFCLVPKFGYFFVTIASPIAWLCADLFLIPAYFHVMNQLKKKFDKEVN